MVCRTRNYALTSCSPSVRIDLTHCCLETFLCRVHDHSHSDCYFFRIFFFILFLLRLFFAPVPASQTACKSQYRDARYDTRSSRCTPVSHHFFQPAGSSQSLDIRFGIMLKHLNTQIRPAMSNTSRDVCSVAIQAWARTSHQGMTQRLADKAESTHRVLLS